jgi:hypothetical protein
MLEKVDGGALGDARARDPGALTSNARKHRRQAPWEAVSEIWERPLSTLRYVDGGSPSPHYGGFDLHPGSVWCVVSCIGMIDKK